MPTPRHTPARIRLNEEELDLLLDRLRDAGYLEITHELIERMLPVDADSLTSAVLLAEGFEIDDTSKKQRRDIRTVVDAVFKQHKISKGEAPPDRTAKQRSSAASRPSRHRRS